MLLRSLRLSVLSLAVLAITLLSLLSRYTAWAQDSDRPNAKDNVELARLYSEDQSDRMPADGKPIDWKTVHPRDSVREVRVKELYTKNQLRTGADYYHVAMVLQHAKAPEDYLLAHELCVVAISKGEERAKWLAAASEDRFLMSIGRPQRFGTQYRSDGSGSMQLYQVDEGVTDSLRGALDVPSLEDAKSLEVRRGPKEK